MARSLLAVVVVSVGMAAYSATLKVPLKTGWKFVKADDPKYVCDASMSNEIRWGQTLRNRCKTPLCVFECSAIGFMDA